MDISDNIDLFYITKNNNNNIGLFYIIIKNNNNNNIDLLYFIIKNQ